MPIVSMCMNVFVRVSWRSDVCRTEHVCKVAVETTLIRSSPLQDTQNRCELSFALHSAWAALQWVSYISHQNVHQNPAVELWSNGMHTSIFRLLKGLLNCIVFFVFLFHSPLVSLSRLLNNRLISFIWFNRDYFSQPWLLHSFRRQKGETYTKRHEVPPQLKSLLNAPSLPGGRGWGWIA